MEIGLSANCIIIEISVQQANGEDKSCTGVLIVKSRISRSTRVERRERKRLNETVIQCTFQIKQPVSTDENYNFENNKRPRENLSVSGRSGHNGYYYFIFLNSTRNRVNMFRPTKCTFVSL